MSSTVNDDHRIYDRSDRRTYVNDDHRIYDYSDRSTVNNDNRKYGDIIYNDIRVIIAIESVAQLRQLLAGLDADGVASAFAALRLGDASAAVAAAREGDAVRASEIMMAAGREKMRESTRQLSADAGGRKSLRSAHGTYLSAPEPGKEVALAHGAGHLENWYIEDWGAKVVLKARGAPNKPGRFLQAHPDGRVDLSYKHPKQCEGQMWKPFQNDDDGTWSLLSIHGGWLSARADGSLCTVRNWNCDAWEHFGLERW